MLLSLTLRRYLRRHSLVSDEITRRSPTWLGSSALMLTLGLATIHANPLGEQVTYGDAVITRQGDVLTVNQGSNTAIINWQDFSIGVSEATRFLQNSPDAAVLNRVLGANPSVLDGLLQANGSVYLINQNGIMVGPQGRIDTGAFFASTLDVSDADFLNGGDLYFGGKAETAIANLGEINTRDGDIILIARKVDNEGILSAEQGVVALAAGTNVLLTPASDQRIMIETNLDVDPTDIRVDNTGLISAAQAELKAAGGDIYDLAINQEGTIRATGVEHRDGRILLTAGGRMVRHAGTSAAHNSDGSGGEILIGGDYQGSNPDIANAGVVDVTEDSMLDTSSLSDQADGGRIIVWADEATRFEGALRADAGTEGGDGGFAEVSGKVHLDFRGDVSLAAPAGEIGTLLLDPDSLVISSDPTSAGFDIIGVGSKSYTATTANSVLNATDLNTLLATTNITLRAGASAVSTGIVIDAPLFWTSGRRLSIHSGSFIDINANIDAGLARLTLGAGNYLAATGVIDNVHLDAGASITAGTLILGGSGSITADSTASRGNVNLAGAIHVNNLVSSSATSTWGSFTAANAANTIVNLKTDDFGGYPVFNAESLHIVDSADGLTIDGNFSGITGGVEIVTTGTLTIGADASVKNSGAADLVLAAQNGSFTNNAAVGEVAADGAGRILAYSDTLTNSTTGNLTLTKLYNHSYAATAPASVTHTGDRLLLSQEALVNVFALVASRNYGAANPMFTFSYGPSLQDGDTSAESFSGAAAGSTVADATTAVGDFTITAALGTLTSNLGYEFVLNNGTLTIDPATLTITPDDATRLYGGADPSFSASYSGFVNGDTSALVSGLTYSTTASVGSDVGTYTINGADATVGSNYTVSHSPGTLTVNQAPLTITANDAARGVGEADPVFSAIYSGLVAGDSESDFAGLTLTTTAEVSSVAGTYPITSAGASNSNYSITFTPGVLTLTGAVVTVTADDFIRNYGASNPTFTASFSGLPPLASATSVTGLDFSTAATTNSDVGTYAITPFGASLDGATFNFVPGTLTIDPVPLNIAINNMTRIYGASNPTFSATYTGLVAGDTLSDITGFTMGTTATTTSGVGDYTITAAGATSSNYTITQSDGTLTVDPASLTITGDDQTVAYGTSHNALTATYSGLVAGDTSSVVSGLGIATAREMGSDVGTYAIISSGATAANYTVQFNDGTLTVDPVQLTVTADNSSRLYGADNATFTGSVSGFVLGDAAAVISGLDYATTTTPTTSVGNYAIVPAGASATNYTFDYVDGELAITPAPLTITADNLSRFYSLENPTPTATYTGLVAGDTAADISGLSLDIIGATTASDVGNYTIDASDASSTNYSITLADGTLEILAAPITVSVADRSRTYGSADATVHAPYISLNPTGASVDATNFSASTARVTNSPVGTYPITVAGAFHPTFNTANYDLTMENGTYIVSPASLTIRADSASRLYGATNPAFTATMSGLVAGDTSSVVSGLSYSSSATPTSPVNGRYGIVPSGATATNYSINYLSGILTINPAPLTLTIGDTSRAYGDANPSTVPFTLTGLQNGEDTSVASISFDFGASQQSAVGAYAVSLGSASADNYTISSAGSGMLTVDTRKVIVTASDVSQSASDPDPSFRARIENVASFDSVDFLSDLTFTKQALNDGSGGFLIIPSAGAVANYELTFVNGLLTYTSFPLVLTVSNLTGIYGLAVPTVFPVTAQGLRDGDTVDDVLLSVGLLGYPGDHRPVGAYEILARIGLNTDYEVTIVPGVFTITPASLFIRPNDLVTTISGDGLPTQFTATLTGLVSGESQNSAFPNLTLEVLGTPNGIGGELPIVVSGGATNPNYKVTTGEGTLGYSTVLVIDQEVGDLNIDVDIQPENKPTLGNTDIKVGTKYDWGTPFNLPPSQLGILDEVSDYIESQMNEMDPVAKLNTMVLLGIVGGDLDSWMADLSTNPTKQAMLLPFFASYTEKLAMTPASRRTPMQQAFCDGIERSISAQRKLVAAKAQQKLAEFNSKNTSRNKSLGSLFGKAQWDDFIDEATDDVTSQIMQGPGAALLGGAAGAGAGLAIGATAATIFPFAASGGTIAAVGAVAATGGAAIVAVSVAVGVVAAVQMFDQADTEKAFQQYQDQANAPVDLNEMMRSGQGGEIMAGLLGMLGGF